MKHDIMDLLADIAISMNDPTPPRDDLSVSPGESTFDAYSNFDHEMQPGAEDRLKAGEIGAHSAYNFYGRLWHKDGLYHEEVWQRRCPLEVIIRPSLAELISDVNDKYGHE
jgi:hypothetical protein